MKYKLFIGLLFTAFSSIPSNPMPIVDDSIIEEIEEDEEEITLTRNEVPEVKNIDFDEEIISLNEIDEWEQYKNIIFTPVDETVYATTSVNIRKYPDKNSEKLGCLGFSKEIKRVAIGDNGWSRVLYNNEECYINSNYLSKEKPVEIVKESTNESQQAYFIQSQGNVDISNVKIANSYYMSIPSNVRNFIERNGLTIYVVDYNLAKKFYDGIYSSVMGVTVYEEKTIYLENRKNAVTNATVHEVGHLFDGALGYVSNYSDFMEVYNAEKDIFVEYGTTSKYASTNPVEYFAELFQQTILHPESCAKNSPMSYNYMVELINSVE